MIAIDGGTVLRATKARSIALESVRDAHMLMKNSISPPTVNAIAGFADRAVATSLKPDVRKLYKRNILDSLGCAISALPGAPFAALREQFAEYRSGGSCTLIGGGKTAPDQAALFNSGLVRYVDLLDSYMSPGGLCHPSDNFGAILAAAEHAKASGEDFMVALAVAYEIQCRFTAVVPVMAKGFQPCHSACNLRGRGRRKAVRTDRRADCACDLDRNRRQHFAYLRPCRAGIAVEGLFSRNDRHAGRLFRIARQAGFYRSVRTFRGSKRPAADVRSGDRRRLVQ